MKVLSIGYGRHLFDTDNFERRRLVQLSTAVDSLDHVVFTKASDSLERVTEDSFTLHPTNSASKASMIFDAISVCRKLIKEKQIDVVSTQDPFETGFIGIVLKLLHPNIRLQVQEHGDVLSSTHWRKEKFSNQVRYWFAFRVLKRADVIRVVSKRTAGFLRSRLGDEKQIRRLPVIVDLSAFTPETGLRERTGGTFTFLTAARFVAQKNLPLLLKAFAKVYATHSHVRLRIFGDGECKSQLFSLVKSLKIEDAIEISGWTDSLETEMKQADAYILTSNYEGWARVLIEALLLKLPIVSTDVGCVGEVVKQEVHGLVVPVDDETALVNAMEKIASNTTVYQELQRNLDSINMSALPGTDMHAYGQLWAQTLR